jgi:PBP1b-binding outer membrane lipoprotein LpoB
MKKLLTLVSLSVAAGLFGGCKTDSAPKEKEAAGVAVTSGPKMVTMDVNAQDYNDMAQKIEDSLAHSGKVTRSNVVSLGPVGVSVDGPYVMDPKTLQEKIQTVALKQGLIQFNFATEAISTNSAAAERYKIMELQWTKESAVDAESLRTFGTLADVNYLLFGRLSSKTAKSGNASEVTFTFNWKLGDCKTGLLIWADEMEITKSSNGK